MRGTPLNGKAGRFFLLISPSHANCSNSYFPLGFCPFCTVAPAQQEGAGPKKGTKTFYFMGIPKRCCFDGQRGYCKCTTKRWKIR